MCVCECACLKTKRKYFATIIVILLNSILSWLLHFLWSIPKANFLGFFLWMWYCNSKSVTQILINPCDFYQKKFFTLHQRHNPLICFSSLHHAFLLFLVSHLIYSPFFRLFSPSLYTIHNCLLLQRYSSTSTA